MKNLQCPTGFSRLTISTGTVLETNLNIGDYFCNTSNPRLRRIRIR